MPTATWRWMITRSSGASGPGFDHLQQQTALHLRFLSPRGEDSAGIFDTRKKQPQTAGGTRGGDHAGGGGARDNARVGLRIAPHPGIMDPGSRPGMTGGSRSGERDCRASLAKTGTMDATPSLVVIPAEAGIQSPVFFSTISSGEKMENEGAPAQPTPDGWQLKAML